MADFLFGVQDCAIAAYTSTGSYDTLQDVVAISQFEVEEQTTNAELEGDDIVVATHAKARVVSVRVRFAFRDLEVYEIMTGVDLAGSSGSADEVATFGSRNYPYFGIIGKIDEVNATGCQHLFIPKAKLMSGFTWSAQYGQFVTPEMTIMGVNDGPYGAFQILQYSSEMPLVMPPA